MQVHHPYAQTHDHMGAYQTSIPLLQPSIDPSCYGTILHQHFTHTMIISTNVESRIDTNICTIGGGMQSVCVCV